MDIPSKTNREGAVKYTDWTIGHFIEEARRKPWFDDTLFVVVADHCASVAGKTTIPPDRYRIPAIFYGPKFFEPRRVETMASQIDLAPTLAKWLGADDGGRFLGQDLFAPNPARRAWLGNYQQVGMLTEDPDGSRHLVVLSPKRRVEQYRVEPGGVTRLEPSEDPRVERAIADYQFAESLLNQGRYRPAAERVAAR